MIPYATNRIVNETKDITILVFLFFSALMLRLLRLFDLDIWFDEVVILFQIKGSFVDIWNLCKTDNFPPLFPWLLKVWHSVFPGENTARLFSALVGSLTPPTAYVFGKELIDRRLGWLLGVACCISSPLIYYSQMIRMYALFPFFACLSIFGFLLGLKTNHWKYWILVSITNLLGFYTFVFMLFLITMEFIILLWFTRSTLARLFRPLVAHLPAVILMLLWIVPLLQRFQQLQESFWLPPLSEIEFGKLWLFLGTGSDFGDHYLIASIINLPFLFGFLIGIKDWWKNDALKVIVLIFFGSIALVFLLSIVWQSLFFKRYFLFILPIYLGLVLAGWSLRRSPLLRRLGMGVTFLSLIITLSYYYIEYFEYHEDWAFPVPLSKSEKSNGHAISETADLIRERISPDEVIVHYSNPIHRSFSFFPMVYYHDRSLPEYVYSAKPIPQYNGQQYLMPGEWITALDNICPPPQGIWIVSLDPVERLFGIDSPGVKVMGWRWVCNENLPEEIRKAGFSPIDNIRCGGVVVLHCRRKARLISETTYGSLHSAPVGIDELNLW